MGKGIILRVQNGTKLSPQILKTLGRLLPGYQLQYFTEKPDYQESIIRRIDSLYNSFLFVLKAYPPNPKSTFLTVETLEHYAKQCRAACDVTKSSIEDMQLELVKFTAKLVEGLSQHQDWQKEVAIEEAIETLNEAEQYLLMNQERYDIATLTPLDFADGKEKGFTLEWEESLTAHYPKLIKELKEIKAQGYPKTEALFRTEHNINPYQKAYFTNSENKAYLASTKENKDTLISHKEISNELDGLILKLKSQKLQPTDLERIAQDKPPFPSWYKELSPPLKAMMKSLASQYPSTIEQELKQFSLKMKEEAEKNQGLINLTRSPSIALWYWELSDRQQCFLEYVLKTTSTLEEALSFISSRHRTIPLPANFAKHRCYYIDQKGQEKLLSTEYRSSHISSRDVLKGSKEVQLRHSSANFAMVTREAKQDQNILMQTNISPVYASRLAERIVEIPPDLDLYENGKSAVEFSKRSKQTIQTNHPFNFVKHLTPTQAKDDNCQQLIKLAESKSNGNPELAELLSDYINVLNMAPNLTNITNVTNMVDRDGRELYLSSLEHLIIMKCGGYSYGSCVSGKDRKAIELVHTDAMLLFKQLNGSFPKFKDTSTRKQFIALVATLYCSRHQHEHAGQNAPGSEGIKTPHNYFPQDIIDEINKRFGTPSGAKYDDILATNNEVKNIKYGSNRLPYYMLGKDLLIGQLIAKQLGEDNCRKLYTSLSNLLGEEQLFLINTQSTGIITGFFSSGKNKKCAGIEEIISLMENEECGDSITRIAKIFSIVLSRSEKEAYISQGRTEATKLVYSQIRELIYPTSSKALLSDRLCKTIACWDKLLENEKEKRTKNATAVI